MKRYERLHWVLWHPHQKLWNWRLHDGLALIPGVGRFMSGVVVATDSLLLAIRVITRRIRRLGVRSLLRELPLPDRVLYVDCGTHRAGLQVRLIHEWFGSQVDLRVLAFEASPTHFECAKRALIDIPNLDLRQEALVSSHHLEKTVRLYRSPGDGKADSLFAEAGTDSDDVPAVRLSASLASIEGTIILRMNIEGAEAFVIDDLIAAGLLDRIAGFYGMWDDLSKISPAEDDKFRERLREHAVRQVPFNDRDINHSLRMWAIRYDLVTSLAASATSTSRHREARG